MHGNDEMALKKKRISLCFFLIIVLILAGLCGIWAWGSIYSCFTEKSEQLTQIEEKISQYYHKRFPLNEDTENSLTFDKMFEKIIQDDDSISSNAQRLQNEKINISRAQFRIKEEKEKLLEEITYLQGFFKKNFNRNLDEQSIIAIKNRIRDLETRVRESQDQYQTLAKKEQDIRRLLNTYMENISSLYVSLGGRGKHDTNDQINFIKAKIKELNKGVLPPPKPFSASPKTNISKVQSQTVPTKKTSSKKQTPPRKKLNEIQYKIECLIKTTEKQFLGFGSEKEIVERISIGCDRHDPDQFEIVYINKSISKIYNAQTKEEVHFYVSGDLIKENIVSTQRDDLLVRTLPDGNANVFMALPRGARVRPIKNTNIPKPWIEIKFPTEEIYFVVEQ